MREDIVRGAVDGAFLAHALDPETLRREWRHAARVAAAHPDGRTRTEFHWRARVLLAALERRDHDRVA